MATGGLGMEWLPRPEGRLGARQNASAEGTAERLKAVSKGRSEVSRADSKCIHPLTEHVIRKGPSS